MENIIQLEDINVSYLYNGKGYNSIKHIFLKSLFQNPFNKIEVLHNINLTIQKGESIGIFGRNGCGKSTLLRTISGIIQPDSGKIRVNLPISPLLELGAGIEPDLSGYDNIRLALILSSNYTRGMRKELMEKVAEFSELSHEQLLRPLRTYSSGMIARVAFSSSLVTDPQLLLIDEVLAVGDIGFKNKCKNRIIDMIDTGTTLLFASHIINDIDVLCNRGICIENGIITYDGDSQGAIEEYKNMFKKHKTI